MSALVAAWLLAQHHRVTLFESESRLGGHTHTHRIDTPDGTLALAPWEAAIVWRDA